MKQVRVQVEAVFEVYIENDVEDEVLETMATHNVLEEIHKWEEKGDGFLTPDLYLATYGATVTDIEDV